MHTRSWVSVSVRFELDGTLEGVSSRTAKGLKGASEAGRGGFGQMGDVAALRGAQGDAG